MVIKDILITGVSDEEIRKRSLGLLELDQKSDKEVVKFVEEKEMALKAWSSSRGGSIGSGSSGYNYDTENDK